MKIVGSPFDSLQIQTTPQRIERLAQIPRGPDALARMGGCVIDLIPRSERLSHNYLRGASLGAVVHNLLEDGCLNTVANGEDPQIHFAEGPSAYGYADHIARSIARGEGYNDIQFPMDMRQSLAERMGTDPNAPLPAIILGLRPEFNEYVLLPSTRGAQEGVVWDGIVTLDMIDRHSRTAIKKILAPLR